MDPWSYVTWQRYEWSYQHNAPLLWNTPGGDLDTSLSSTAAVAATPGTTTTWDVTQLVQKEVSGFMPPYGFELSQDGEATNQVLGFTSTYASDGNPQPTLTVTWEEPSRAGADAEIVTGSGDWFGTTPVGTTTPTQEIDIQNDGDAPLTFGSLALAGTSPGDFRIESTTCTSAAIPQYGFCKITLSSTPTAVGNRWATLVITDNAPNSPQHVALQVNATAGTPPPQQYKLLQDYLFRYIAREAGRLGMAVHIHALEGGGGFYRAAGSDPLLARYFSIPSASCCSDCDVVRRRPSLTAARMRASATSRQ